MRCAAVEYSHYHVTIRMDVDPEFDVPGVTVTVNGEEGRLQYPVGTNFQPRNIRNTRKECPGKAAGQDHNGRDEDASFALACSWACDLLVFVLLVFIGGSGAGFFPAPDHPMLSFAIPSLHALVPYFGC